jgi:thymidylate synthase (FAD)
VQRVEPQVYLIGETRLVHDNSDTPGLEEFLHAVGAPEWSSDAPSDVELLPEVYGRLCYRSFAPGLNPNVTKVREGNDVYLKNVIEVKHGSVTEHSQVNFVFHNVSRVFTHELVRHRVGVAISQESLRYVRLDALRAWLPACLDLDEWAHNKFEEVYEYLEKVQRELAEHFKIDEMKNFNDKKKLTSAFRRLAPEGLATTIGWSANIRTLRFVLPLRSHRTAEEEMRLVFDSVGKMLTERYPNLFGDFKREVVDGIGEWTSDNWKI